MSQEICICGLMEACHPSEICAEFETQGLILNTVGSILAGTSLKPEYINNPVVMERSMLDLLRRTIINLRLINKGMPKL